MAKSLIFPVPLLTSTRILLIIACLAGSSWATLANAAATDPLHDDIEAAAAGDIGRYAPATLGKARDYLGAAILADQNNNAAEAETDIDKGREMLTEAHRISDDFQKQYTDLINLRQETETAESYLVTPTSPDAPNAFQAAKKDADFSWGETIRLMEAGQLGESQQQAMLAQSGYAHALDAAMPELSTIATDRLSEAASAGAKRYAPQTYARAKDQVAALRAYADGLSAQRPEHPLAAVELATDAEQLAQTIRQLRRDDGSIETLLTESRAFRRELATSLGMSVDPAHPTVDVPADAIIKRAVELRQDLADEKAAHARDLGSLDQAHAAIEQLKTEQQQMAQASNAQLSSMKEAFRAKLERETFDLNRQKKVKALLKPDEAEVLVNLDGSLLIRLSSLKFASGHSRVDHKYFDLLQHVKEALDVYSDRKVRIEGHTDNQGDVKVNQRLSLKRAEAVRDILVKDGLDAGRVKALGYGEVRPIASNEFDKGRAMNRRIDIIIEAAKHD